MIINCSYSNPRWIQKSGEIRTLEPLDTAGTNANFQFASSTCSTIGTSTNEIIVATTSQSFYNGFSAGEILVIFFLFLIMLGLVTGFILKMFKK